jgi:hypothetical protein
MAQACTPAALCIHHHSPASHSMAGELSCVRHLVCPTWFACCPADCPVIPVHTVGYVVAPAGYAAYRFENIR